MYIHTTYNMRMRVYTFINRGVARHCCRRTVIFVREPTTRRRQHGCVTKRCPCVLASCIQAMYKMSTGPQLLGSISSAPTGIQTEKTHNWMIMCIGICIRRCERVRIGQACLARFVYENIFQSVCRSPANSRYPTYVFDKGRRHARSLNDMFTR